MKPFFAALGAAALWASGPLPDSHAAESEPELQDSIVTTRPKLPMLKDGKQKRSVLLCSFRSQRSQVTHVLSCRFADSKDCVLAAPVPLKEMLQRFDGVKITKIGASPDGCSELTFRGSLREPHASPSAEK